MWRNLLLALMKNIAKDITVEQTDITQWLRLPWQLSELHG